MKVLIAIFLLISSTAFAKNSDIYKKESWGVGIGYRTTNVLYDTDEGHVGDVIPLLFYQGENVYLDGLSGGVYIYQGERFSSGLEAKARLFDLPKRYQNLIQATQLDFGGGITFHYTPEMDIKLSLLSDVDGRTYSALSTQYQINGGRWDAQPFAMIEAKSSRFNNAYYGLFHKDIGSGFQYTAGIKGRYQLYENLYAVGKSSVTLLDGKTYRNGAVNERVDWDAFLGVAFFNSPGQKTHSQLDNKAYIRMATGVATESSFMDILGFHNKTDPNRNKMSSLFYGHPIADSLFGMPIDFYLTTGYVHHHKSNVQSSFSEYVLAIKAYYTFKWPTRWRLGFAEGVSYSEKISYIEHKGVMNNGYYPSRFMNYLDLSVDVNVGDLIGNKTLRNLWLGYSVHHRSGIFTQSSAFGRIKGGSDYNTLYLQWDF
uniref:MipA/OmpV family protein n=1 Tax=Thaumasiovibrio subtropicus TaxID=1891207 RepID=UPI000B35A81F|nr:MipA/OmpV family protein [Thaumasiovibrio subtropicus]